MQTTTVASTEPIVSPVEGAEAAAENQEPIVDVVPTPAIASQVQNAAGENNSAPVFAHIALLEKRKISLSDLPGPIKMSINAWNMGLRKYNKQKTAKLLEMQKKGSVRIADAIQTWLEKDLPEKSEEEIKAENEIKLKAEREKEAAANRAKAESERRAREFEQRRNIQQRPVQKTKEQKVAEVLAAKGKIHYNELVEILGREVGENVQVGNIKLMNMFLTNNYKQVR